jgi:hypothetical protein
MSAVTTFVSSRITTRDDPDERARRGARRGLRLCQADRCQGRALIDWQGDPSFNNDQHQANPHDSDAFQDYGNGLRTETMSFAGQVVLVHGDSHFFKVDKPINLPSGGVLANFTRVETFGARQSHWVSAPIDPSDPNLFEFEPRIVPANVG